MQLGAVGRVEPVGQRRFRDQFGQSAEPAGLQSQHGVVDGILAERGMKRQRTESGSGNGFQDGVELLQFEDGVFEFRSAFHLSVAAGLGGDGHDAAQLGFQPLPQRADVLRAKLRQRVRVQLVIVQQTRERRRRAGRELAALQLPGDRSLLELLRVMLEELGGQPGVERLAHHFGEVTGVDLVGPQPLLHTLEQRRFLGERRDWNDSIRVGPVGDRFAGFDLLGPTVAE